MTSHLPTRRRHRGLALLACVCFALLSVLAAAAPSASAQTRILFQPSGRAISALSPEDGRAHELFRAERGSIGFVTASRSGRQIAFITRRRSGSGAVIDEVWLMRGNGAKPHRVRRFRSSNSSKQGHGRLTALDISNDGSRLVLTRGNDLFTMSVDGGNLRPVAPRLHVYDPEFGPGGGKIVLSYATRGKYEIGSVDVRSGTLKDLGVEGDSPTVSDDGKQIAFVKIPGYIPGPCDVWLMQSDGDAPRRVKRLPCGADLGGLDFSPNGRSILLVRDWKNVYTMRRDGSNLRRLIAATYPTSSFYNLTPQWTPG
jgi:WD40-like Beta Propeller Repeat